MEPTFLDITHGDDTAHNREKDNRYNNKLQQVQKDRTKWFDIVFSKLSMALHQQTGNDGQNQSNKNLSGQRKFLLFFILVFSLS